MSTQPGLDQPDIEADPEVAVLPSTNVSDYGAVYGDGLQKRNRSRDEDSGTVPRTPRTGDTGKYVGVKGSESKPLLLERSSDEKEL